ncbi:hypothetical protein Acr_12g0003280 [Actinidia rufa]|uniref:Uncharacterized protein n=1 Tax=Actinidia rufa TaxID=165716 RepID=A0A7J0FIP8_9ERIC|nr:hypothetical protein Acr_12g0003280 [Actinidia rufa]
MSPRRKGQGCREAVTPEDRFDRIERILEGLVQVVQDTHNNHPAQEQPAMPMPGAEAMNRTTIKQFQQLSPPTFLGTLDPMAAEA